MTKPRHQEIRGFSTSLLKGPLVLPADLLFLLRGEVILDVEGLADLLWGFALDHVSNSLAGQVQQTLDVEIVRSLNLGRTDQKKCQTIIAIYTVYNYENKKKNSMTIENAKSKAQQQCL
jgi:hypothetical protein